MSDDEFRFTYRNHRNEVAERRVLPIRIWFGSTEWHPEPQWFLNACDLDKTTGMINLYRDFAMKDIGCHAAPAPVGDGVIEEIRAERLRQIEKEGWTPDHDWHVHPHGELALAAACYAVEGVAHKDHEFIERLWPFSTKWWKPRDRRRNLIRAAALIVAEIERLDR